MWTRHILQRNKQILEKHLRGYVVSASPLQIERALVLSKMTKYEVERHCNPGLSEDQLERQIRSRGSDYDSLIKHHRRHKDFERQVLETLKENRIKTKLHTRLDYFEQSVESCDAVFPVGGDGTFLLAASRVRDNTTPVIGFNSDPNHSEGFLCIPKQHSIDHVLKRLKEGSFSWMYRTRIRVTLNSKTQEPPVQLHDRISGESRENVLTRETSPAASHKPALALNEVFVGELLSAQVSYFELRGDGQQSTRVKSSGLCVCTGTGSSSWHLSMNRTTGEEVARVLRCATQMDLSRPSQHSPITDIDPDAIADKYNQSLLFNPEEGKMCYTIRDLICAGVWPSPPGLAPRGFARSMWVRSYGQDARLVIDGGTSYTFNDGSEATFQLLPEDALKTIVL